MTQSAPQAGGPWEGRTVLVTGGGTGIGRGCAERFLSKGATVTIAGPDQPVLEEASDFLEAATGRRPQWSVCDVTEEEQISAAVDVAAGGANLDVLVANAGSGWPGPIQLLDKEGWRFPLELNIVGTSLSFKHASRVMKRHRRGAIVAISSVEGLRANRFMPAYSVTKAAVDALVASAARELGGFNIRVNGIRPGVVLTEAVQNSFNTEMFDHCRATTYLDRLGEVEDVAKAVDFLASDDASWITGQLLGVCGGLSVQDGEDFESIARMLYGDEAIDATIPQPTA